MAKFIAGNKLNLEIEQIIEKANESIILISPFIKLHNRYQSALKTKMDNPKIAVTVVFGKNAEQMQKSMTFADFDFFRQFPNIEIRFEKNLHAKYYANEKSAILTSMNLYSYSQDNNIEAGIITTNSLATKATNFVIGGLVDDVDNEAYNYFLRVVNQSELLFENRPVYEDKLFGLTKKYKESIVQKDQLSEFFSNLEKKSAHGSIAIQYGFCIRTGVQIPFNLDKPLCDQSFKSWNQFKNEKYEENYCHLTGELSYGETCYSRPVLYKNWKKATELQSRSLSM